MYLGLVDMKELENLYIFGPRRLQQLDIENCKKLSTKLLHPPVEIHSLNCGFLKSVSISLDGSSPNTVFEVSMKDSLKSYGFTNF